MSRFNGNIVIPWDSKYTVFACSSPSMGSQVDDNIFFNIDSSFVRIPQQRDNISTICRVDGIRKGFILIPIHFSHKENFFCTV